MTPNARGVDWPDRPAATGLNKEKARESGRLDAGIRRHSRLNLRKEHMRRLALLLLGAAAIGATTNALAAAGKPNIVVIMGDDIGMWNIGAYHRGMMAGRTPNLDQIAKEGMLFTDYYAEASCTAGRANFITGELPI